MAEWAWALVSWLRGNSVMDEMDWLWCWMMRQAVLRKNTPLVQCLMRCPLITTDERFRTHTEAYTEDAGLHVDEFDPVMEALLVNADIQIIIELLQHRDPPHWNSEEGVMRWISGVERPCFASKRPWIWVAATFGRVNVTRYLIQHAAKDTRFIGATQATHDAWNKTYNAWLSNPIHDDVGVDKRIHQLVDTQSDAPAYIQKWFNSRRWVRPSTHHARYALRFAIVAFTKLWANARPQRKQQALRMCRRADARVQIMPMPWTIHIPSEPSFDDIVRQHKARELARQVSVSEQVDLKDGDHHGDHGAMNIENSVALTSSSPPDLRRKRSSNALTVDTHASPRSTRALPSGPQRIHSPH
jgi:hypothetical protein